jgi:hypothetical protein
MRRLAALALLVVACSTQPSATAPTHSGSTSSNACRLPIRYVSIDQGVEKVQAGFVTLPGSLLTPAGNAGEGLYYNRTLARWVEWAPAVQSDDGSSYAYVDGDRSSSRLHIVDLRANKDRVLAEGGPWNVIGLQPDAVYVTRVEYLPDSPAFGVLVKPLGLSKVPLAGGGEVQLTDDTRAWVYVSQGAAWALSRSLNIAGAPSDVLRLDLQTKQVTTWFAPGKRTAVLAIDSSGVPLIMSEADTYDLWRVPAPNRAVKVWSAADNSMGPYDPAAVDGSVIWFSSHSMARESGIYRYSPEKGIELVANFKDRLVWVAGPCA